MGCCQYYRGYLNPKSKNSSTSLNKLKETNLSNKNFKTEDNNNRVEIDKLLNKMIKNKKPEFALLKNKKNVFLDKIKEEDSEYKEEITLIQQHTQINSKRDSSQNKMLRKNKSYSKFNTKLSEELFHKKLNEYKEMNISKDNYLDHRIKESKTENNFNIVNSNDDDTNEEIGKNNFEIYRYNIYNILKLNKDIDSPKKSKIGNIKPNRKFIKIYEEDEINANTIPHTPKYIFSEVSSKAKN